jgi:hypothetical protein
MSASSESEVNPGRPADDRMCTDSIQKDPHAMVSVGQGSVATVGALDSLEVGLLGRGWMNDG